MVANYQEMAERYGMMSNDDLLRVAVDQDSLTTIARETLAEELRKRRFDDPDAIQEYEREQDQQIKQEEELAAAVRWSNRSRLQRVFDYLKQHPLVAILASIGAPALAFVIRIWNGNPASWQWPHPRLSRVSYAHTRWCMWNSGCAFLG